MRTPALVSASILITGALAAACSGGSSSGSGTPPATTPPATTSNQAAAQAAITTAWQTFFNSKTPHAVAERYLEGGANLGPAIAAAARIQRKIHLTENAKVTKVVLTSSTTATVTYNLVGTPLQGATGQAVYQNGKWLVSKNTFCGLVELGDPGKKIPGCN